MSDTTDKKTILERNMERSQRRLAGSDPTIDRFASRKQKADEEILAAGAVVRSSAAAIEARTAAAQSIVNLEEEKKILDAKINERGTFLTNREAVGIQRTIQSSISTENIRRDVNTFKVDPRTRASAERMLARGQDPDLVLNRLEKRRSHIEADLVSTSEMDNISIGDKINELSGTAKSWRGVARGTAIAETARDLQRRRGMDPDSIGRSAEHFIGVHGRQLEQGRIQSEVAGGKYGKNLDDAAQKFVDTVGRLKQASEELIELKKDETEQGRQAIREKAAEVNQLLGSARDTDDAMGMMRKRGGGGKWGNRAALMLGGAQAAGSALTANAAYRRYADITSEFELSEARTGYATIANMRYADQAKMYQGDMSATSRTMSGVYAMMGLRGATLGGIEGSIQTEEMFGRGLSAAGQAAGAGLQAGAMGSMTGGSAGAVLSGGTAFIDSAATSMSQIGAQAVGYSKGIPQSKADLETQQRYLELFDQMMAVPNELMQKSRDADVSLADAFRGVGRGQISLSQITTPGHGVSDVFNDRSRIPGSIQNIAKDAKANAPGASANPNASFWDTISSWDNIKAGFAAIPGIIGLGGGSAGGGAANSGMNMLSGSSTRGSGAGTSTALDFVASKYGNVSYKMGGKIMQTGEIDCSGFTRHVSSELGWDPGIGSVGQLDKARKEGRFSSDMSTAKSGDVMLWKGHAALYAGRDKNNNVLAWESTGADNGVVKNIVSERRLKGLIGVSHAPDSAREAIAKGQTVAPGTVYSGTGPVSGPSTTTVGSDRYEDMFTTAQQLRSHFASAAGGGLSDKEQQQTYGAIKNALGVKANAMTGVDVGGGLPSSMQQMFTGTQQAGRWSQAGYLNSPEQYTNMLGTVADKGGGVSNLESILRAAVAAGLDSSKNMQQMVSGISAVAGQGGEKTGVMAIKGAENMVMSSVKTLQDMGVDPNLQAPMAAVQAATANAQTGHRQFNRGSIYTQTRYQNLGLGSFDAALMQTVDKKTFQEVQHLVDAGKTREAQLTAQRAGVGHVLFDGNKLRRTPTGERWTEQGIRTNTAGATLNNIGPLMPGGELGDMIERIDPKSGGPAKGLTQRQLDFNYKNNIVRGLEQTGGALYGTPVDNGRTPDFTNRGARSGAATDAGHEVPATAMAKEIAAGAKIIKDSYGGLEQYTQKLKESLSSWNPAAMAKNAGDAATNLGKVKDAAADLIPALQALLKTAQKLPPPPEAK